MKISAIIMAFLSICTTSCYSQITIITSKEKEEVKVIQKYDSLENMDFHNASLHAGQTLFIKGSSYFKENNYFPNIFFTKLITDSLFLNRQEYIYKPIKVFRKGEYEFVSDYPAIVGKYYKIKSVDFIDTRLQPKTYWFTLIDEENSLFYFNLINHSSKCFAFVTLGYYEKMKKTFVGKEFYSKGRYDIENVDTKEQIELPYKIKFKCTDIAVNVGEDGPVFAVLENEKYGRMKGEIIKGTKLNHFITTSYYNQCVKKYGQKFGSYVAEGKIEIGMNEKMVLDAWGSPQKTNVTRGSFGVHEQWVYDDRYLYFKNGILTSTQF